MKKKLLWLIPVIILIGLYLAIFNSSYEASDYAKEVANKGQEHDHYLSFGQGDTGIIMYPGGKVSYEAYAPLMKDLSDEGYKTFLVEMPLDLAIFGNDRAREVIEDHPEIKTWYIMGHSLGGVMAAQYAYENDLDGLILLASYPQDKHDFSDKDMKVLSMLGSLDGLVDMETFENSKKQFPKETTYTIIEGGNHAFMGAYGKQKNDLDATIKEEKQRQIIIDAINKLIN